MGYRLRVEEDNLNHAVWGNLVDLEIKDEAEELGILEILEKYLQRPAKVFHDERELLEKASERAKSLRDKGVTSKKRGMRRKRRR